MSMTHKSDSRGAATVTCAGKCGLAVAAASAMVAGPTLVTGSAVITVPTTVTGSAVIAVPTTVTWTAAVPSVSAVVIAVPSGSALSTEVVVATSPVPIVTPTRVPKVTWTPLRERAYLSLSLRSDTQTGQS